jgi:hypothetical protein
VTALLGHDFADLLANRDNPDPPYPDLVALMESAGPVNHVDGSDPPFFVAHGDEDRTVPPAQSAPFVQALQEAGVPVEYHPVPGAGHNGAAMPGDPARAFLLNALTSWSFETDCTSAPDLLTDASPVTLTASASGGTPPCSFSWDVDGARYAGNPITLNLAAGGHPVALTASDDTGAEAHATKTLTVLQAPAISHVGALVDPFRLRVKGTSFQEGCQVLVNGAPAPRTVHKSEGLVIAKGEGLKARVPKGVPVTVEVLNPDGARSQPLEFVR